MCGLPCYETLLDKNSTGAALSFEVILLQLMTKECMRDITPVNTVVSLFRKSARENPDRTAEIFKDKKDKKFTYKEVDEISEKIAAYVASKNFGRGEVVLILIPRGEFQVLASFGALKTGCAYQPLDATYPPERLNFMVKDSSAKLLITNEELRTLVSDYDGEVLYLSEVNLSDTVFTYGRFN